MVSKVAVVELDGDYSKPLKQALDLVGGIGDLNTATRNVIIKVGIFHPRSPHHASMGLVKALVDSFSKAPRIFIAESDNYVGRALDRLQFYKDVFTDRVVPLSLSESVGTKRFKIAGEEMGLSEVMLKPNVFVDTHVLRNFSRGSVLKNLFGCTPTVQKAKYHKKEVFGRLLADIYEAIGGIDLAVADGACLFQSATETKVKANTLIVGRDAVAVETVVDTLAGLNTEKMEFLNEFTSRGLGEASMKNIEIVGTKPEKLNEKFGILRKKLRIKYASRPRAPSISRTIDRLVEEGWMKRPRTVIEVLNEMKRRSVLNATRAVVATTLNRRQGKTLKRSKSNGEWAYQKKSI